MRDIPTPQLVLAAVPHGPPLSTRLIGRAHDALTAVHDGGAATAALILFVAGVAVFLAASGWVAAAGERRRVPAAWTLTAIRVAALGVAFCALGYQVKVAGRLTSADQPVLDWLAGHRSAWLTGPAIAVTDAGGPAGTVVLAILLGAVLCRRARSLIPAIIVIGTVGAAALASTITKTLVGRQRPPLLSQVLLETDHSFPSGHATGAMALFGMAAVTLGYSLPTGRRWALFVLAGVLTVVVAATRLYLGEHWLTDVIGGVLLGGVAALAGSAIYTGWTRRNGATGRRDPLIEQSGTTHETTIGTAA